MPLTSFFRIGNGISLKVPNLPAMKMQLENMKAIKKYSLFFTI